ncbi:MAG TPA: tetratricopeptide repeat protein [Armatimonadota bacterium]
MLVVLLMIIGSLAALYPLLRILLAWRVEQKMRGTIAFGSTMAHVLIIGVGLAQKNPFLIIGYLLLVNLLWILTPRSVSISEVLFRKRMRDADIARYQRLIRQRPEHAAAHAALADAYLESGRFDEAIAAYQQAIALSPESSRQERRKLHMAEQLRTRKSAHDLPTPDGGI